MDSLAGEVRLRDWTPAPEKQSGKEQAAATASRASQQMSLTETTADGRADAASALRHLGLEIGGYVQEKTGGNVLWVLEGIVKLKTGKQVIHLMKMPDKKISKKAEPATLSEKFKRPPAGYEHWLLRVDASWKEREPRLCKGACVASVQADVVCALEVAARLHPDSSAAVIPMLNLRNQVAEIRSANFAKAGAIIMVPWTDNVKIAFPGDVAAMNAVGPFEVQYADGSPLCKFAVAGKKPKIWLEAKAFQDKGGKEEQNRSNSALLWAVGSEPKEKRDKINMTLGWVEVDALGTITKESPNLHVYRAKKTDFSLTARTSKISIPVLVNSKDVQANEVLKYEKREKVQQETNKTKPILTSGLLKRIAASTEEPPAKKSHQ